MKLDFEIGDTVKVKYTSSFYYDENDERQIDSSRIEAEPMIVCGAVRRRLGKFRPGCSHSSIDGDEYEEAYLEVKKTVVMIQVRIGMFGKIREALPEHCKKMKRQTSKGL